MAMKISTAEAADLWEKAKRMHSRAKGIAEKSADVIATGVDAAVTQAVAFGFGVANGRFDGLEVAGAPVDLIVGVGAHLVGFTGGAGESSRHLHSIGNGALASYFVTVGAGVGSRMATAAASERAATRRTGTTPTSSTRQTAASRPARGVTAGDDVLSDSELAQLARAAAGAHV